MTTETQIAAPTEHPVTETPVPCAHIADYYRLAWEARPSIGTNLLRIGYAQWSTGRVIDRTANNLFGQEPAEPDPIRHPGDVLPIETDHLGRALEVGFSIVPSSGSAEMDIRSIDVHLLDGTNFVSIVSDEHEGHAFFDIADIDGVIEALTRIRDSRSITVEQIDRRPGPVDDRPPVEF